MIELYIDRRSGVSPYLQIVEQVKRALLLGTLHVGDQLPTLKEVVGKLAINPNTVLKAYRELEYEGLIETRPGLGTFVIRSPAGPLDSHAGLRASLLDWLKEARQAGLDEESIVALFDSTRRESRVKEGI
ncbi:MAG: GntR family transcriptional regulator [SAR202 cluster bacterium]|nr:GntR family transcriptional regulator [SAR202 cluster bacterium]